MPRKRAGVIVLIGLVTATCMTRIPSGTNNPATTGLEREAQAQQIWQAAQIAEQAGHRSESVRLRQELIETYPESSQADRARLQEGQRLLEEGDYEAARERIESMWRPPADILGLRASALARAWTGLDAHDRAAEILERAWQRLAPGPERNAVGQQWALAEFAQGNFESAARTFAETQGLTTTEVPARFETALRDGLPGEVWEKLSPDQRRQTSVESTWGALVLLVRVEQLRDMGQFRDGLALLRSQLDNVRDASLRDRLQALQQSLEVVAEVNPRAIGVLLPLSGKYESVGQSALTPLKMVFELPVASAWTLQVVDTTGSEEGARRALDRLLAESKVLAALGPVGYREAEAAAGAAEPRGLVLLPLSGADGLDRERPHVFATIAGKADEARRLAGEARQRLQLGKAAMLFPDNPYGQEYAAAFRAEFERLGGSVTAAAAYAPDTRDPTPAIAALVGRATPPAKDWRPAFDALLIADQSHAARRLLPLLKYWRVPLKMKPTAPGVQLLGTSAWTLGAIVDQAEALTDNAFFLAPWLPPQPSAQVAAAIDQLTHKLGRPPTPFEAQVYDAAAWLLDTLVTAKPTDREALRSALHQKCPFSGPGGVIVCLPGGHIGRELMPLTVDGSRIRPRLPEGQERLFRQILR